MFVYNIYSLMIMNGIPKLSFIKSVSADSIVEAEFIAGDCRNCIIVRV